jgi:hypothetical protein
VALEHLDHAVLVDRPVEDQMVLLSRNQDHTVVMGMGQLLDLVVFHKQLSVALGVGSEENVEGVGVSDVKDFAVVGEVQTHDVLVVLFNYLCRLELLQELRAQLQR